MKDIETMFKRGIFFTRDLNKISNKRILWDSERLSNDYIVPILEERKCKFNKI